MSKCVVQAALLTALLGYVSIKVLDLIYHKQKGHYIDEIFHVDQVQRYCNNNWLEWNPKITTFPGLYITSYILIKPFHMAGYQDFCNLYTLRLTNIFATMLNFVLALNIFNSLDKKYMMKTHMYIRLASALNIAIFPPLYFFTFLYYTDVWSATFVLLMYHLHLSEKFPKFFIGLSGIMAVLMRQTNIIWVGLLIIDKVWGTISKNHKTGPIQNYKDSKVIIKHLFSGIFNSSGKKPNFLFNLVVSIISEIYHLVFICVLFIAFVVYNGSIVLGDKTAHTPVLHPMQNLYFLSCAAFFGFPFVLIEVSTIWKKPPSLLLIIILIVSCTVLSELNKLEHPYLLADNRHLAFYIWKRIFGHRIIRRIIIPSYIVSGLVFCRHLQKRCHFMFMIALFVCTFFNLTPQHLFELRYFIIPYVMLRLHIKQHPIVLMETIFFATVNISIVYLFVSKPFEWPTEPGVTQRFIW